MELILGRMNDIQIFNNARFGQIRTTGTSENPLFCLTDICKILDLDSSAVRRRIDDGVISNHLTPDNLGRNQLTTFINEDGLYDVILDSRKSEARQFRKWVTSEVLPSIRNHGAYATDVTIEKMLNDPDFAIQLLTTLKDERTKRIEAEKTVSILTHVNKTYTCTEIAKELGFKSAIELNNKLHELGIQYKVNGTWIPYTNYAQLALFEIKQESLDNGRVIYHRRITGIGREYIIKLLRS